MEALVEQACLGGPWSLGIYGNRRYQNRIFLNNGPSAFERLLVFKFQSCPGLFAPYCGWGETLVLGAAGGQSSLYACVLQLHDLWFWSVVSEKQLHLIKQDGPILSWVCSYSLVEMLWEVLAPPSLIPFDLPHPSYRRMGGFFKWCFVKLALSSIAITGGNSHCSLTQKASVNQHFPWQ